MNDDYNDTNQGDPRETPDEKEIYRLETELSALSAQLEAAKKEALGWEQDSKIHQANTRSVRAALAEMTEQKEVELKRGEQWCSDFIEMRKERDALKAKLDAARVALEAARNGGCSYGHRLNAAQLSQIDTAIAAIETAQKEDE